LLQVVSNAFGLPCHLRANEQKTTCQSARCISSTEIAPIIGGSKITKAHLVSEIVVLFTPQFTGYCISMQECIEAF